MQVDNSGTTVVFDAKTTQAIEEGKNRITMLQVEELRLKNLKKDLEQQIIKLEADIDYKEDKVMELGSILDEHEKELEETTSKLVEEVANRATIIAKLAERENAVQAKETALHEKELAVNAKKLELDELVEKYQKDWAVTEKAKDAAEAKLRKIDTFLKSL